MNYTRLNKPQVTTSRVREMRSMVRHCSWNIELHQTGEVHSNNKVISFSVISPFGNEGLSYSRSRLEQFEGVSLFHSPSVEGI